MKLVVTSYGNAPGLPWRRKDDMRVLRKYTLPVGRTAPSRAIVSHSGSFYQKQISYANTFSQSGVRINVSGRGIAPEKVDEETGATPVRCRSVPTSSAIAPATPSSRFNCPDCISFTFLDFKTTKQRPYRSAETDDAGAV